MSNTQEQRTANMVHFPLRNVARPFALDDYLDNLTIAVTPEMYGGTKNDNSVDNVAAIEAAFAASNVVIFDGIYYVGDGGVDIGSAGTLVALSPTCGVKAVNGLTETTGNGLLNITASGVNILGLLVDGDDAFRRGIRDTSGGALVERCDIKNLYSDDASAVGIYANATAGGSTYRLNRISEIESVGDATPGNDDGAARAVQIFTTGAVTKPYVVCDNDIYRIIGEEGDGIQLICFASSTFYSSAKSVIANNKIERCSKRGIKIQAHECTVQDNNVVLLVDAGTNKFCGIDVINSEDVTVDGNIVHVTSTMRGINVTATSTGAAKRVIVSNNRIKTDVSASVQAVLVNEFEDCAVLNNYCEYGYINVTAGSKAVVSGNVGNDLLSSGTISFIISNSTAEQLKIFGNVVLSGAIFAAVHVQGSDNFISNNSRVDGDYRCVYLSTANATDNVVAYNVSVSSTYDAAIFSTVTVADQTFVKGNVSLSLAQAGPIAAAYTASEIADVSDAVNTANKIEGLIVYDTTNDRLMVSSGAAAGSAWWVADGSAAVSPT